MSGDLRSLLSFSGTRPARLRPGVYVLLFHGVEVNLSKSMMSAKTSTDLRHFKSQVACLRESVRVVSLKDALSLLASGDELKQPYGAITFDDAYRNVLQNAIPVLDHLNLPATIFVCHNPASRVKGLWRHRLSMLLLEKKTQSLSRLNGMLDTEWHSAVTCFNWSKDHYSIELEKAIDTVWCDLDMGDKDLDAYASYEELMSLDCSRYSFGSHTISHPVLTRIRADAARREIIEGHRLVEAGMQRQLEYFAYPFGARQHWGARCVAYLRELPGVYGISAYGGANWEIDRDDVRRIGFTNHSVKDVKRMLASASKRHK